MTPEQRSAVATMQAECLRLWSSEEVFRFLRLLDLNEWIADLCSLEVDG